MWSISKEACSDDRITIGAAPSGAAVYFLDPQRGEDRRRRVQSFWRENRDAAFEGLLDLLIRNGGE